MKKLIAFIVIFSILIGLIYYFYKGQNNSNDYEVERTIASKNESQNNNQIDSQNTKPANNQVNSPTTIQQESHTPVESEELATFSTKIYTKDSNRQNNVSITCSTLNNTDVANGEEFSFCNTVGRASPSKGYKKADIFTNGEKTKGYGGGNCQVSTTLYNAVLTVPNLNVTERHEHSNKVPYIKSGKDAAVAFGSYDFKFINNTGSNIRIKAENSADSVVIKLIKLV